MNNIIENFQNSIISGGAFLIIGVIGLVILGCSFLIIMGSGAYGTFDLDDNPFSLLSISAFLTIFGFMSYLMIASFNMKALTAALIGVGVGVLVVIGPWQFTRYLRKRDVDNEVAQEQRDRH